MPFPPQKDGKTLTHQATPIQIADGIHGKAPWSGPRSEHRIFSMDRALRGMRTGLVFLTAGLMLSGCAGQWQSEQTRLRSEYQRLRGEEQQRANYAACVDQGAMPGSAENLACQMEMAKKQQEAAKPQSPANKSP
jgi:hypothetical protein